MARCPQSLGHVLFNSTMYILQYCKNYRASSYRNLKNLLMNCEKCKCVIERGRGEQSFYCLPKSCNLNVF